MFLADYVDDECFDIHDYDDGTAHDTNHDTDDDTDDGTNDKTDDDTDDGGRENLYTIKVPEGKKCVRLRVLVCRLNKESDIRFRHSSLRCKLPCGESFKNVFNGPFSGGGS